MSKIRDKAPKKKESPIEIFLRIQRDGSGISREAAEKYCAEIRRERRASGLAMSRRSEKAWAAVGMKY